MLTSSRRVFVLCRLKKTGKRLRATVRFTMEDRLLFLFALYSIYLCAFMLCFAAKQRDKATSDVQLKDIPAQIRAKDGQIDMLKREIDYDNVAKKELQKNTDAQNSITVLKEQAVTELENLQESVNENSYAFTKFNMDAPALPAADADANGEDLVETIETFSTETKNKFETTKQELDKAKDDQAEKQRDVSEKSALLSHNKQTLASLRSRLDALGGENGSVGRFQRAVNAIRQYEQSAGMPSVLQGSDPQVVMAHLSSRLEEIEKAASGSIQADVLSKIMDDLYKMVSYWTRTSLNPFKNVAYLSFSLRSRRSRRTA